VDCAGVPCGNGICEKGENPFLCPEDCKKFICGNNICEPGEDLNGSTPCVKDCGTACGNCICEGGESFDTCPVDCGYCGDGYCSPCVSLKETETTCNKDCKETPPVDVDAVDIEFMMVDVISEDVSEANEVMDGSCTDDGIDSSTDEEFVDGDETEIIEGGFMWPCKQNSDCLSMICYPYAKSPTGSICTIFCTESCPEDFECKVINFGGDVIYICVPPIETLCKKCEHDEECIVGGGYCLEYKDGKFCSNDCVQYDGCPKGYECLEFEKDEYMVKQCLPKSGSCICAEGTDYTQDVNNCGYCTNKCTYLHGVPACLEGKCKMIGCEDGWVNLDLKEETGCEYECTYKGEEDPPDPLAMDDNCDGIDGVVSKGVFVSKEGMDEGNNLGTMDFPFLTINAAVQFAAQESKQNVYIAAGVYSEQVFVVPGVNLFGGYDASTNWNRDITCNETRISWDQPEADKAIMTIVAKGVNEETMFDGFTVESGNNALPGASSYAVYVSECTVKMKFTHNIIRSGNGGQGINGMTGLNGMDGGQGGDGSSGCEYGGQTGCGNCTQPQAGAGGSSLCEMTGGKGGDGGLNNGSGKEGITAANGGGMGGTGGSTTLIGGKGTQGGSGTAGASGTGGEEMGLVDEFGFWQPSGGTKGDGGTDGHGGGGGGGGGGDDSCCCYSYGGSGGGGGGGGCGGEGGMAGGGGGGSFGIFIHQSTVTITNNTIQYGNGGNGGAGGSGGKGGVGGSAGKGGTAAPGDNSGAGGDSGNGGVGGDGGHGGGGGGGAAFGIYIAPGSNPLCSSNTFFAAGMGGSGGIGGGPPHDVTDGKNGSFGSTYAATEMCKE
jgi:hypothetical protein